MNASHNENGLLPAANWITPAAMRRPPTTWPHRPATVVARSMLPVTFQIALRRILPPSRGNPGTRLNTPRMTFTRARSCIAASIGRPTVCPSTQKIAARTNVEAGPAAVTRNSEPGPFSSTRAVVAPPNRYSVMLPTAMPLARAVPAWASSCTKTDPKKSTDARIATARAVPGESTKGRSLNRLHSLYATSSAISVQDGSIRMSIPPMDPIRHALPNTGPA